MYTSVADLAKFVAANTVHAKRGLASGVLPEKTIRQMWMPNEVNAEYGMGFQLFAGPDDTNVIFHGGSNIGWKAHFFAIPDRGSGIVVLTNTDTGAARMDILNLWRAWVF